MTNDRQRPHHQLSAAPERLTRQGAFGFALTTTAVVMVIVKFMTGIVWTGALGIALLVFCLSFAMAIRLSRGVRQ